MVATMAYLLLILCCALFQLQGASAAYSPYTQECEVWYNVSRHIEAQPSTNVVCTVNRACTGVDCNGAYTYFSGLMGYGDQTTDLCFGVMVEPCQVPVTTFTYIIIPESSTKFKHRFNSTTHNFPVPGTDFSQGPVDFSGVLDVDMAHVESLPYTDVFTLGMTYRLMMSTSSWIRSGPINKETLRLVPDVDVYVPPCNPAIHNQELVPDQCTNETAPQPLSTPPPRHIACEVNTRGQCPTNSLCDSVDRVCVCAGSSYWNTDHTQCVGDGDSTDIPIYIPDDLPPDSSDKSTVKRVLTVVGAIVGSLLVVGVIFGILIIKFRRYKARYGDHMLLNSHDDVGSVEPSADDDVPPIDITE